ncbi:MAG: hypothetical protein H8D22_08310, partial [Candidatus Cloacimonetes bacterium]|nr:hypothetical protein [Candidatus Cloacimonadota bacterium]
MLKILGKLSAFVAVILIIIGVIDKIFFPHSNIILQHENYFIAANPFILFAILFYLVDFVHK